MVLEDLRSDPHFFRPNNFIRYEIPKEDEILDKQTYIQKVLAIKDLEVWGAITIRNKGEERFSGSNRYEFEIFIVQPAFDGIYKKCVLQTVKLSLEEYELRIENERNLVSINKKLKEFIRINNIIGKEKNLINTLADLKPHEITELEIPTSSKDIPTLRLSVNKKLNKVGFDIKSIRSNISYPPKRASYQLVYLSLPNSNKDLTDWRRPEPLKVLREPINNQEN